MRQDCRLSRMLHVLLHMERLEHPLTSETIAKMLGTNPGVIRRTMAGLRDAGFVAAEKGHGGGWTLKMPLQEITLWDVYMALGEPRLFALGNPSDSGGCPLENVAEDALDKGFAVARVAFGEHLSGITLAQLVARAEERNAAPITGDGGIDADPFAAPRLPRRRGRVPAAARAR